MFLIFVSFLLSIEHCVVVSLLSNVFFLFKLVCDEA